MKAWGQLVLIIFLLFRQLGFTQLVLGKDNYDFISIKPVEINFLQELKLVSSSSDTAQVYANHIKQLIKRDNHHKADTILQGTVENFIATNNTLLLADL